MPPGTLGSRAGALEILSHPARGAFDIAVVGGGITGAGIALDAASRGLRTALVERFDFASGTSSKSSKLVHGGLRYLEQKEFALVREASTERELLGRLAPHLVEPIPFVIPVSDRWKRAMFGVGLWAYDALSSFRNLSIHRRLTAEETEGMLPALVRGKIRGGYLFYDSRTDDVRLVMEVLVQARRHGAVIANYTEVEHIEGSEDMCTVAARDSVSDQAFEFRAKRVVVAAGVWTDRVEAITGGGGGARLRPSKGIHLVFSRSAIPVQEAAGFIPDADRRRMLFVIPWLDAVLVGTTDTPYEGDLDNPAVTEEDRRYCLDALNQAFGLDLNVSDIEGAYAGLRPLIAGKAGATADLSRRHAVYDIGPGVIGITGGKLTTFRKMAEDAVDRVAGAIGASRESRTRFIRLGSSDVVALRLAVDRRATRLGLDRAAAAELVRCFGDRALAVLDIAEEATELAAPLAPGTLPLAAAAAYCARHEMATTLDDVLSRRTRLALTDRDGGIGRDSRAVEVMSRSLGWSRLQRRRQVAAYRERIEAERGFPIGRADESRSEPAEGAG